MALKNRKDYASRQWEAVAARKDLSLAKRERLPNPTLGLEFVQETGVIEGKDIVGNPAIVGGIQRIEDKDKRVGLKLGLPLPLFNRKQGEVSRAEASIRVSDSVLKDLRQKIRTEVREFTKATKAPLKQHIEEHPFPIFGSLNAHDWLIYVPLHTIRHSKQIVEVQETEGYPAG